MGSGNVDGESNQVRWSLAEGINPVFGDFKPDLELPDDMTCVDIQLVMGPCLVDEDFITDYSEPSPRGGNLRRYCSLPDRLAKEEVSRLRDRLAHALADVSKKTSCGEAWVLWGSPLTEEEEKDYVPHYDLSGWCDSASLNGSMSIFECEREDLLWYRGRFCDFDRFAGVASVAEGMPRILSLLNLKSPWPSTRSNTFRFDQKGFSAETFRRLLNAEGTFFFEEIDNGTRLRIVSLNHSRAQLVEALEPHLDEPEPR